MFNEQLEKLVEMALIDGVLTEKEREILKRKAESSGFDPDEFEIVLEAKLYEKQIAKQSETSQELDIKGIDLLFKKITDIQDEPEPEIKVQKADFVKTEDVDSFFSNVVTYLNNESNADTKKETKNKMEEWKSKQKERILDLIKTSPIPNSIEDIITFLTYSVPLSIKGGEIPKILGALRVNRNFKILEAAGNYTSERDEAQIINNNDLGHKGCNYAILLRYNWKLKSEQLVKKARTLMGENKDFKNQIDVFAKELGMPTDSSGGFFSFLK